MRLRRLIAVALVAAATSAPAAPPLCAEPVIVAQACCKTCRKGKACGDSCIARDKTCAKPPGCACDG